MDIRLAMKSKTKLNMNVEFGTPEKTQHFQEHEIYFYILPTGTHSKLRMSRLILPRGNRIKQKKNNSYKRTNCPVGCKKHNV